MPGTAPPPTLDVAIRMIVRAELARVLGSASRDTYSTTPGAWPPGARSRRSARDRIRAVPGCTRIGTGPATVWTVSRAAYAAHHGRCTATLTVVPTLDVEALDVEALADRAIEAAKLRPTKRSA